MVVVKKLVGVSKVSVLDVSQIQELVILRSI